MKRSVLLSALCLFVASRAFGTSFDLEMTGPEYRELLKRPEYQTRTSDEIDNILKVGKRNLDWINLVNANRPANQQLELYSPALQVGIPMDAPREYNEATVLRDYNDLLAELPVAFKEVLLGFDALPITHPLDSDEEYLTWTRKTDKVYQSASRWKIMEPYLWSLASRSYNDIRGYYFLNEIPNLQEQLQSWNSLSTETQAQYTEWLVLECHNNQLNKNTCRTNLARFVASNNVWDFHSSYVGAARKTFESFFAIRNPRRDVVWDSTSPLLTMLPFLKPESLEVQNWLVDNIEDEWQWNDWKLKLNFVEEDNNTTYVVFSPGATPNVNGLGGNRITMDANRSLYDYSSKWTIRHEYGHVLGLPDCYIEFYDTDRQIIINYQIDLDNLMCSRRGKLQEKHYLELKKNYFTQN